VEVDFWITIFHSLPLASVLPVRNYGSLMIKGENVGRDL
jgi:hypothetical protein